MHIPTALPFVLAASQIPALAQNVDLWTKIILGAAGLIALIVSWRLLRRPFADDRNEDEYRPNCLLACFQFLSGTHPNDLRGASPSTHLTAAALGAAVLIPAGMAFGGVWLHTADQGWSPLDRAILAAAAATILGIVDLVTMKATSVRGFRIALTVVLSLALAIPAILHLASDDIAKQHAKERLDDLAKGTGTIVKVQEAAKNPTPLEKELSAKLGDIRTQEGSLREARVKIVAELSRFQRQIIAEKDGVDEDGRRRLAGEGDKHGAAKKFAAAEDAKLKKADQDLAALKVEADKVEARLKIIADERTAGTAGVVKDLESASRKTAETKATSFMSKVRLFIATLSQGGPLYWLATGLIVLVCLILDSVAVFAKIALGSPNAEMEAHRADLRRVLLTERVRRQKDHAAERAMLETEAELRALKLQLEADAAKRNASVAAEAALGAGKLEQTTAAELAKLELDPAGAEHRLFALLKTVVDRLIKGVTADEPPSAETPPPAAAADEQENGTGTEPAADPATPFPPVVVSTVFRAPSPAPVAEPAPAVPPGAPAGEEPKTPAPSTATSTGTAAPGEPAPQRVLPPPPPAIHRNGTGQANGNSPRP